MCGDILVLVFVGSIKNSADRIPLKMTLAIAKSYSNILKE